MSDHYDEMRVSPDPSRAEDLRGRLHARMARMSRDVHVRDAAAIEDPPVTEYGAAVDPYVRAPAARPDRRRRVRPAMLGAAAAVLLIAVTAVLVRRDEQAIEPFTPVPAANGWVAQQFGSKIWLEREGETSRQVDAHGEQGFEACPAFSPDGARLLFGRDPYGGGDATLEVVTVTADGTTSPLSTIPLEGGDGIPCAIWAPDGRWAALGSGGDVWVVDTHSAEVRRLPGYDPRDLEWRPGTDELAITGRATTGSGVGDNAPITIYTVHTGEVRTLDDVEAAELTWSPDGTTLAYTQAVPGAAYTKSGITLIDADGTNRRPLTTDDYVANHGVGVTWSPLGDQIAYQRQRADCTGAACNEQSEVVLVTATDTDPESPMGSERVVPPVVSNLDPTGDRNGADHLRREPWYANSVTWSPDGTELLYSAGAAGLIAVPVDSARPATVLSDDLLTGINDRYASTPWIPLQQWQPIP